MISFLSLHQADILIKLSKLWRNKFLWSGTTAKVRAQTLETDSPGLDVPVSAVVQMCNWEFMFQYLCLQNGVASFCEVYINE